MRQVAVALCSWGPTMEEAGAPSHVLHAVFFPICILWQHSRSLGCHFGFGFEVLVIGLDSLRAHAI